MNGELFSSSTYDLIIYFCVVENLGFVQIWRVTLDHIIAAFSVQCTFQHTHSSQCIRLNTNPPKCRQELLMYLMMLVVVTTTARSSSAIFSFQSVCFVLLKALSVQNGLKRREKAGKTSSAKLSHQSTRSRSKPQNRRSHFLSLSSCCCSSLSKQKKNTHTNTQGQRKGGDGDDTGSRQLVVPNLTLFFLSQ